MSDKFNKLLARVTKLEDKLSASECRIVKVLNRKAGLAGYEPLRSHAELLNAIIKREKPPVKRKGRSRTKSKG